MKILAKLWPFKKRLTLEHTNQFCPGSGSLWEGKYRRVRCSTSNGLERHLPGDYQTSLRYFAKCPHCKFERAISKSKKLFVKHTWANTYHASHYQLQRTRQSLEDRRALTPSNRGGVPKNPPRPESLPPRSRPGNPKNRENHSVCGKPLPRSIEELARFKASPRSTIEAPGGDRWYCTCGETVVLKEKENAV